MKGQRTIFPCYAPADAGTAQALAEMLRTCAEVEVFLEEGEIRPGQDLLSKAAEALTADVILVLVSPDSVPVRPPRDKWEPILQTQPNERGTFVGIVQAGVCGFYPRLENGRQFDLTRDRAGGMRAIKRWILQMDARADEPRITRPQNFRADERALDRLQQILGDNQGRAELYAPEPCGKTTLALAFVRRSWQDFERVVWLGCGGRSSVGLLGDLAERAGWKLEGEPAADWRAFEEHCAGRRYLIVFDDLRDADAVTFCPGGRCSVLATMRSREAAGCWGEAIPFQAFSPEATGMEQALAGLSAREYDLLAAFGASSPGTVPLGFASRVARLDEPDAAAVAQELVFQGMLAEVEGKAGLYSLPAMVRQRLLSSGGSDLWPRRHAEVAARENSIPAELAHALDWALRDPVEDWALACEIGRRGMAVTREQKRSGETLEFAERLFQAAEARKDLRILNECAWEKAWLFESWGRTDKAREIEAERRKHYAAQLSFEFA